MDTHTDEKKQEFIQNWKVYFGRKGWLRPTVLRVLQSEPLDGVGIIRKIYVMSHGWWRPSPGSIYPLLSELINEGVIIKRKDGKYEIKGVNKVGSEMNEMEDIANNMEGIAEYLEELSKSDKKAFIEYKTRLKNANSRIANTLR